MLKLLLPVVLSSTLLVPAETAASSWDLPGVGGVDATVEAVDGRLRLEVTSGSAAVLSVADLGMITSAGDLSKDLELTAQSHRTVRTAYRMTTGKQRERRVHQEESRLFLRTSAGGSPINRSVDVRARGAGRRAGTRASRRQRRSG